MQNIDNYNFKGKKALIRVDFNVPLNDNLEITDDTRIRAAIPTLKKLINEGAAVIILSHMGRPKGVDEKLSLKNIVPRISEYLGQPVKFAPDCQNADKEVADLKPGEVLLLENLRFYPEEEGKPRGLAKDASEEDKKAAKAALKERQIPFAQKLASYGDCYIDDAFGAAHRAHAANVVITRFFPEDKMFGYLMQAEIDALEKVVQQPKRPLTAILGGAKVSSKIGIIEYLLDVVDNMLIGGGMAYTFIKAQGGKIGNSLVEDDQIELALKILQKAKDKNVNLMVSDEVIAADKFDNKANSQLCPANSIPDGWMGVDASPRAIEKWKITLMNSSTILWNGPVGVFEMPNFSQGTKALAQILADATAENGTYTLVGGGDSVAAIHQVGCADKVSYVSTGGGAMLEYLEGKVLPGIKAIRE